MVVNHTNLGGSDVQTFPSAVRNRSYFLTWSLAQVNKKV